MAFTFDSYREYFASNASAYVAELIADVEDKEEFESLKTALYNAFLSLSDERIEELSGTVIGYSYDSFAELID